MTINYTTRLTFSSCESVASVCVARGRTFLKIARISGTCSARQLFEGRTKFVKICAVLHRNPRADRDVEVFETKLGAQVVKLHLHHFQLLSKECRLTGVLVARSWMTDRTFHLSVWEDGIRNRKKSRPSHFRCPNPSR